MNIKNLNNQNINIKAELPESFKNTLNKAKLKLVN